MTSIPTPPSATSPPSRVLPPPPSAPKKPIGTPPEWAIEKFVKSVGKGPAALKRILDRLAEKPIIGPVVKFFSSIWVGISVLALIGAYIAFGSGLASWRARFEMTDLEFFDAWPMRVLLVALGTDLIVVTLRRIPLTLFKLGSWTVHVGILTLITGSVLYFSQKHEGSVRIYLHQTVDSYFDGTERALYVYPVDKNGKIDQLAGTMTPLPGMPIYFERTQEGGNPLSYAVAPTIDGAKITIREYYPAADLVQGGWRAAKTGENGNGPGIRVGIGEMSAWLIGKSPAGRLGELANIHIAVEYLYHPTAERVRQLASSFDGELGVTVRIPALEIERTYPAVIGKEIAIEGSPYKITPLNLSEMPMASKGYENASSTIMSIGVAREDGPGKEFNFERQAVFRYPERSPDWVMENGKKARKQEGVDPNIQISFQDARGVQAWIIEDEAGKFTLIARGTDGRAVTMPMDKEKGAAVDVKGLPPGFSPLTLHVDEKAEELAATVVPAIIPPEARPKGIGPMDAVVRSVIMVDVEKGDWKQEGVYVPFVQFTDFAGTNLPPGVVDVPMGNGSTKRLALVMATTKRPLPSRLTLADFEAIKYPGAQRSYADYISTLKVEPAGGEASETMVASLNSPARDQGMTYFQAGWAGPDAKPGAEFSVIGVGNRPGIEVMKWGAIILISGILYAFYVKPILLNKKKAELKAWAEGKAAE